MDDSNHPMIPTAQNNSLSSDSVDIKQECEIKQEPADDLVDIPAPTYRNSTYVPDCKAHADENYFDCLILNKVKDETKKEYDDKKKEKPNVNSDSDEEAADGQQVENDLLQPDNDKSARNTHNNGRNSNENSSKVHKCNDCDFSTKYKCNLNKHVLKHTGEKPHECRFCPKRFTLKRDLRAHMKVHVKEFLFHCSGCLEGFNEKDEKAEHETSCKVRRYECHLCEESCGPEKPKLVQQMRVHSGDKPFHCEECFKQFTKKSSLNRHKKLHASPRSFRCSKSIGLRKSDFIRHMRIHTGEKPFQCTECLKKFNWKSDLKRHMKIHAKKLRFKCLICRQGFLNDRKRKAHQRNCNGRNYECHLCHKHFGSLKTNLAIHMRCYSGEKPFQCSWCQNNFSQKGNLTNHLNQIHKKNR